MCGADGPNVDPLHTKFGRRAVRPAGPQRELLDQPDQPGRERQTGSVERDLEHGERPWTDACDTSDDDRAGPIRVEHTVESTDAEVERKLVAAARTRRCSELDPCACGVWTRSKRLGDGVALGTLTGRRLGTASSANHRPRRLRCATLEIPQCTNKPSRALGNNRSLSELLGHRLRSVARPTVPGWTRRR
jgi:hypothetical protein